MTKDYSSIVCPINRELDWGFTDAEVDGLSSWMN